MVSQNEFACVYMPACASACVHACVCVYLQKFLKNTYTHIRIHIHIYTHTYLHIHTHIHTYACIHTHTYTHAHIHTHLCVHIDFRLITYFNLFHSNQWCYKRDCWVEIMILYRTLKHVTKRVYFLKPFKWKYGFKPEDEFVHREILHQTAFLRCYTTTTTTITTTKIYPAITSATGFDNYEDEYKKFELKVPEYFNFAEDVLEKWSLKEENGIRNSSHPAFWWIDDDGNEIQWTFKEILEEANRVSNVLSDVCQIKHMYVVSCCFMLFHVVSCCFMLFHVVSCCFMLFHVVSCCFVLFRVVSCCFVLFRVVSCCFMLFHVVSCCFMLFHVVSYCVLNYLNLFVSFCEKLGYFMLLRNNAVVIVT